MKTNYITPNFSFSKMQPVSGKGSLVIDDKGCEYIDLAGGIAVNALGHCHPELIHALQDQAQKLWHISNLYSNLPMQELAGKLVRHTFADKVFFANSGAEANEASLKLARKYAFDRFGEQKNEIVSCVNAFHGRTLFTVSVGGQEKYQKGFGPLPKGIRYVPFNDVQALCEMVSEKTCAVILEPIQGESGVLPASLEFIQTAREVCTKFQVALIFDEVQTGMGRTGKLFAYQHFGIEPDILTSAKALGCGVPIGAMLTREEFAQGFTVGSHGSTFGGNPLACAVGSRAFDIINNPDTLANVLHQGQAFEASLNDIGKRYGVFSTVRGKGLLIGCVLSDEFAGRAGEFVQLALDEGVMILQAGANVVRLAPALIIQDTDREEGLRRFAKACEKLSS